MKKNTLLLNFSVMVMLAFSSNDAFAASQTTTIKLQGQISPSSCDIAMDNAGSIKLNSSGGVNKSSVTGSIALPTKKLGLMILCRGATSFAFRSRDIALNAGNVQLPGENSRELFSLGMTNNGQAIGGYLAVIDRQHSSMDGKTIPNILISENEGASWRSGDTTLSPSGDSIYSWGSQTTPESVRMVNVNIILKPFLFNINHPDSLKINGMTTFEIVYL
ncbi:hypothetical protein AAFN90_06330 [Erwiniaceae bacterium CAU 1747]